MERRFTLKDFLLFAAIGAVLVALLVAMYMIDRQWNMMARMRATMQEQAEDLRALRSDLKALDRRVESGALAAARTAAPQAAPATGPQSAPAGAAHDDPAAASVFDRAAAATRLAAFGGAGPLHAAEVAARIGIPEVIVPPYPGITSAVGLLTTELRYDAVKTQFQVSGELDLDRLNRDLATVEAGIGHQFQADGLDRAEVVFERSGDLRYVGQGYELRVPFPSGAFGPADAESLFRRFHEQHRAEYGHVFEDSPIEIVNVRVAGVGRTPTIGAPRAVSGQSMDAARVRTGRGTFRTAGGGLADVEATFYLRDAVDTLYANTRNNPIEDIESHLPLRVRRYELREGVCGAGKWRGGLGSVREFEYLSDGGGSVEGEGHRFRPWGFRGGDDGQPSALVLARADGSRTALPSKVPHTVVAALHERHRLRSVAATLGGHVAQGARKCPR